MAHARSSRPGGMHTIARIIANWGWLALIAAQATAQNPPTEAIYTGDVVVVVRTAPPRDQADSNGKTSSGKSVAERAAAAGLRPGDKMHVTEVQGDWIGGIVDIKGQRHAIWLRRQDVRLDRLPPAAAAPIRLPDRPDDPQAVAALEKLGVKLERNEQGNVHSADATESKVTDKDLAHFAGLYQLTALDLSGRPVTDAGLNSLRGLVGLQELYLSETQVTDAGLAALPKLANLEILALQKTKVTGAGLVHVKSLPHLLVLNLGHCAITDEDLKQLRPLSLLEVLSLTGTKVTSVGVANLTPLAKLRVLNLIGCAVDDAAVEPMKAMGNLRIVHIRGTKISADAVEAMGIEYPALAFFD